MKCLILGAGSVGSVIAYDLSQDMDVTVADINQTFLDQLKSSQIKVIQADLSDSRILKKIVLDLDIIVGALPHYMGFEVLKSVIETGKKLLISHFSLKMHFNLINWQKKIMYLQ